MVLVVKCLICQKELTYSQSNPVELIQHMKFEHPLARKSKQTVVKATESSFGVNAESLKEFVDKSVQTEKETQSSAMNTGSQQDHSSPFYNQNRTRVSNGSDSYESLANEVTNSQKKSSNERREISNEKPSTSKKERLKMTPENSRTRMNINGYPEESDERQKLLKNKKHPKKFYKTSIERWKPVGDEKINCPRCFAFKRPTVRTQRQHVTDSSVVSSFFMTCWPLCFSPCYLPTPKYENLFCPVCNYHLGIFDHQKKIVISNPNLVQD